MYVAHVNNASYIRAQTLYDLATNSTFKREVISGTIGEYIRHGTSLSRAASSGG